MNTNFQFSDTMIRGLKGAPISCLILLSMARQPVTAQYLERMSGYSDKSVLSALLLLRDYGLVTRNERYAWQIARGVMQLPLMDALPAGEGDEEQGENIAAGVEDEPVVPSSEEMDNAGGKRGNPETEKFRVVSSSGLIHQDTSKKSLPPLERAEAEKIRVREALAECTRRGIREPKRGALCRLAHVTARLVGYHCQTAPNTGLAIYRIEHDWRVPDDWGAEVESLASVPVVEAEPVVDGLLVEKYEQAVALARAGLHDPGGWLAGAHLAAVDAEGWIVRAGNRAGAEWIREHVLAELERAAGVSIRLVW